MRSRCRSLVPGFACIVVALAIASCGGGGSSPGVSPTSSSTVAAAPPLLPNVTPTASTAATAPPSASSSTASVAGRVVDADNGNAPLAGATVQLGNSFAGGTLSSIVATTTTAADGTYSFTAVPTTTKYIQVTLGNEIPAHRVLDFPNLWQLNSPAYLPTPNVVGTTYTEHDIYLTKASSDEAAALVQVNADRATYGVGVGQSAIALDADAEIVARYRANEMAQGGWYSHTEPGTNQGAAGMESCKNGDFCGRGYYNDYLENIDEADPTSTLSRMEQSIVNEGPAGGHYQNVMNSGNVWVGFGEAFNGKTSVTYGNFPNYFAQEFAAAFNGTPR